MPVPHPIPYQGSKRTIASTILQYLPYDTDRLVEPFAGSAAISLSAAYYNRARRFWLNDINKPLMDLWDAIINRPAEIADHYQSLWTDQLGNERKFYDKIRQEFNRSPNPGHLLYLLARCVKAAVRYNSNGEFNQSPDNRRRGARPERMRKHIFGASYLLRNRVELTSLDYREVLTRVTPADVVYMDPPYQGVAQGDPRYMLSINYDEFVEILAELNRRGIPYMLSYDGRRGNKRYGNRLPQYLNLVHVEIIAGRSSQATLLGRNEMTVESLYISPALFERLANRGKELRENAPAFRAIQLTAFDRRRERRMLDD